jgi:periplasmic mercuric ion binding protein
MKRSLLIAAAVIALGAAGILSATSFSSLAFRTAATEDAAVRKATFVVENMTCALCPVTVKKAMERVAGVRSVEIDFDTRTATVAFDPFVTTAEAIAAASTNAGYPATRTSSIPSRPLPATACRATEEPHETGTV